MNTYKVIFENNIPLYARALRFAGKEIIKLIKKNGKMYVKWFIVDCDNEKEAMEVAVKVTKLVWGSMLE
jgi:hypothetical protein